MTIKKRHRSYRKKLLQKANSAEEADNLAKDFRLAFIIGFIEIKKQLIYMIKIGSKTIGLKILLL